MNRTSHSLLLALLWGALLGGGYGAIRREARGAVVMQPETAALIRSGGALSWSSRIIRSGPAASVIRPPRWSSFRKGTRCTPSPPGHGT